MAGHRAVLGLGGPFADVDRPAQLALTVHHRVARRPTGRVARSQIASQFLAQRAAGLHEQRQIDRLVRHAHLRIVGIRLHQPTRDLLRRPPQLELRLHHRPQPCTSPASTASGDGTAAPPPCPRPRPDSGAAAVRRDLATTVDGDRANRRAIARQRLTTGQTPRDLLAFSATTTATATASALAPAADASRAHASHTVARPRPISLSINRALPPLRRQLRDPATAPNSDNRSAMTHLPIDPTRSFLKEWGRVNAIAAGRVVRCRCVRARCSDGCCWWWVVGFRTRVRRSEVGRLGCRAFLR